MFARIHRSGMYDTEVAPMAFLIYAEEQFFITVVSRSDAIHAIIPLRAVRIEDAYSDFKSYVRRNGGVDFDEASDNLAEVAEREAYATRH